MPTRSTYNQPLSSSSNHQIIPNNSSNQVPATGSNVEITSYVGRMLTINQHQVIVEDILGQGGFAFVFLVRAFNQQRYALKRMYVNNERDLVVCQREIAILKEFSSYANIVKYVDSSVQRLSPPSQSNVQKKHAANDDDDDDDDAEDDAIYEILLLTEYCSNGALTTRLNEQRTNGVPLNERQILRIFADICNAVSSCHHRRPQPILHRDIKLENILIDSQQSMLLCDFGSAIMLPPSTQNDYQQYQPNQLTTTVIQQLEEEVQRYTTLSYRAPEMIDLYSRLPITLKADIWAMGCLLYKLMYNVMPFGDSILAIQNGAFVIPDDMAQVYSRDLNILVRYILETDINKRPDIWQVSSVVYKLLGMDCPIPNRCQSRIPDLSTVTIPLTESEFRHQRLMALANAKPTLGGTPDEASTLGTAVNPRERPRGIMAPSGSFFNFNQPAPRLPTAVVPPPPPPPLLPSAAPPPPPTLVPTPSRTSHQRSGSAAQLMFDDDFSQFPNHALSLTNIPNMTATTPKAATATPDRNVSRARPSPPASLSSATGLAFQHQLFPPPPATSSSNTQLTASPLVHHQHRRSASQTISPTNNPAFFQATSSVESTSSFDRRHSVDSSAKPPLASAPPQAEVLFIGEASDDDDDDALGTNLNKLKVHNHSTENVKSRESLILNEDDRLFAKTYTINSQLKSDDEQTSSSGSDDNEINGKTNPKNKKKTQLPLTPLRSSHHPSTEESEKNASSPSTANKNLMKRLIERCSLQQQQPQDEPSASSTPYKRKDSFTLSNDHPIAMGGYSDNKSNSDDDDKDDDDDNGRNHAGNPDANNAGFDQLINEDSDDDGPMQAMNTSKGNAGGGLFTSSRHKEQQYEHFEDSDEDANYSSTKTSSIVEPLASSYNFGGAKQKIPHSESYPPGVNNTANPTSQSSISKDVFTNAPFKSKTTAKQPRTMTTNKTAAISPSSSHSTSSSNSQLIDFTVPPSSVVDSTAKEQSQPSSFRRPVGSAGLAINFGAFGALNTANDRHSLHSERLNNDGQSSSDELNSSLSARRRQSKKKSSIATNTDSQQHAYANLSFNDAIVDELL